MLVRGRALAAICLSFVVFPAQAAEPRPTSGRTLSVALVVNREGARLAAYTVKERPFLAGALDASSAGGSMQLEVTLQGPDGAAIVRRQPIEGLCLEHPRDAEPHVVGDTIRVHEESVVVELPELPGFDRLSIGVQVESLAESHSLTLGTVALDAAHFQRAGGVLTYDDLAISKEEGDLAAVSLAPDAATVHWPEEFSDPDIYRVYGNAAEIERRINVVIVPDGYRYAEKGLMESHAAALVASFRAKAPYAQHDLFFNYVLVYAYSTASGTDQCDCGIVVDTAMGTGFPVGNNICGHSDNRCLYYGSSCDTDALANLSSAELRAPAIDQSIVMVNTDRYGGCGGLRAVYSAGNGAGPDVVTHELGHSFNGLADEYDGTIACGTYAGEINTSLDPSTGAWPEWIAQLGAPWQGAQYYNQCVYRPTPDCHMRSLGPSFCPVCAQHMSLGIFGHPRVQSTAPIASASPVPAPNVRVGKPVRFLVGTRLAQPSTNAITWTVSGPGNPTPVVVQTGTPQLDYVFPADGQYQVACDVIADTDLIKPSRYGSNRDVQTWSVTAACANGGGGLPDGDGDTVANVCDNCPVTYNRSQSDFDLDVQGDRCDVDDGLIYLSNNGNYVEWQAEQGFTSWNLYRGDLAVLRATGVYTQAPGSNLLAARTTGLTVPALQDVDPIPVGKTAFYLVTGLANGVESSLGRDSHGNERPFGSGIVFHSASASADLFPTTGNPTVTQAHTVGAGSNRLLLVFVSGKQGAGALVANCRAASVTFAGAPLTRAGTASVVDGSDFKTVVEAWYRVSPPVGAGVIQMTFPGECSAVQSDAFSLGNVDQSTPIRATASSTIATTQTCTVSTPIAANAGSWAVDSFAYNRSLDATPFAGQTEWTSYHSSVGSLESSTRPSVASPLTLGWSVGSATCGRAVHLVVTIGPS